MCLNQLELVATCRRVFLFVHLYHLPFFLSFVVGSASCSTCLRISFLVLFFMFRICATIEPPYTRPLPPCFPLPLDRQLPFLRWFYFLAHPSGGQQRP